MSQKTRTTFVLVHPAAIVQALVGLKDVRVLHYQRSGPNVELMIEQVTEGIRWPGSIASWGGRRDPEDSVQDRSGCTMSAEAFACATTAAATLPTRWPTNPLRG